MLLYQAHDPMGLIAPPPSTPLPAVAPTTPAPSAEAESLPPWALKALAKAPGAKLGDAMAGKYLLCASLFDVSAKMIEAVVAFEPPSADRDIGVQALSEIKPLGAILMKRGREMIPPGERAAYGRLKPLTDKWSWDLVDRNLVGDMPRYAGCGTLPEVVVAMKGREL